MLQATRGIVFNQVRYGETSIIAKIYTEQSGLQSFLVRGARSKKAKIRSAHLQHLTLVEVELNQRNNKSIQHLKSLKIAVPFRDIPFNMQKSAVVVFLNEILQKVIREEEPNPALFEFLFQAIQVLDLKPGSVSLFHHHFLILLTRYLGFFPRNNYSDERPNFNLEEGKFTAQEGPAGLFFGPPHSKNLATLAQARFETLDSLHLRAKERNELLELLLNYYRLHVPGLKEIKSHAVLTEVFAA